MAIQTLSDLKALINSTIYDNTTNEISGSDVQTALINAIDTLDSAEGFINVHKANGQTTISTYGSKGAARAAVPSDFHYQGIVIAYKLSTGWVIEQNLDATAGTWSDDASWVTTGPVSVSQNTETGKTELLIGDTPALIVDDEPTVGSDNLVKSGGVLNRMSKVFPVLNIVGTGTSGVVTFMESNHITNLIPNHSYRVFIENVDALTSFTTSVNSFELIITDGETPIVLVGLPAGSTRILEKYYDFVLPDGYNEIYMKVRQPSGVSFNAFVQDIENISADSFSVKEVRAISTDKIYQNVILNKDKVTSHTLDLKGSVVLPELFELGSIQFWGSSEGVTYPNYVDSNNRIRTVKDHYIYLQKGDIISPINNDNGFKYYIGWWDDNDSFHYVGWKTGDYILTQDGNYIFLASYEPETTITSLDEVASNFRVIRNNSKQKTFPFYSNALNEYGQIVYDTDCFTSEYIKIEGNKRYRFASPGSKDYLGYKSIVFYSYDDGTGEYTVVSSLETKGILDMAVPQTATHFRMNYQNAKRYDFGNALGIYKLTDFQREFGSFVFFKNEENEMKSLWPNAIIAQNEYRASNFVTNIYYYNVTAFKKIAFSIQNGGNTYGVRIGAYDSNMNYISYEQIISNNPIYTIPSNATFIKISISKLLNGNLNPTSYSDIIDGMITIDYANTELKTVSSNNDFLGLNNLYCAAHRGNTGLAGVPENSVHSVYACAIQGVRSVECDVRYTHDNVPCIMHDSTINRTMMNADGTDITEEINISDIDWSDLRANYVYKSDIEKYRTPITSLDEWLSAVQDCHLVPFMHSCPTELIYKVIEKFGDGFIYMSTSYEWILEVRQLSQNCLCLLDVSFNEDSDSQLITKLKTIKGYAGLSSMVLSRFSDNLRKLVKDNGFYLQYSTEKDYPNAICKGVNILLTDNWCNDNLSYNIVYRMKNDLSNITYVNTQDGCPIYSANDVVNIPISNITGNNVKILIVAKGNLTANVSDIYYWHYSLTGRTDEFTIFEVGYNTDISNFTLKLTMESTVIIRDIVVQQS